MIVVKIVFSFQTLVCEVIKMCFFFVVEDIVFFLVTEDIGQLGQLKLMKLIYKIENHPVDFYTSFELINLVMTVFQR